MIKYLFLKLERKTINMTTKCCWCGTEFTKYYVPPYGMVCGDMCGSIVCIVKKVRFPEEEEEEKEEEEED